MNAYEKFTREVMAKCLTHLDLNDDVSTMRTTLVLGGLTTTWHWLTLRGFKVSMDDVPQLVADILEGVAYDDPDQFLTTWLDAMGQPFDVDGEP